MRVMTTASSACEHPHWLVHATTVDKLVFCEVGIKWGLTRRHGVSAAFEEWRDIIAVVGSTEQILAYKGVV